MQAGELICARFFALATPILGVLCPACQTVGDVDLRKLGRHPGATIASLIPSLPCRSSLRVCRSRSATVEDLAASNSSGASVRFYLLSGGLPTISCGGWSCRIGDHRRCLNVLAAPRDDVHPGTSETSRRDPVRCRGSSTGGGPQAATPQQPAMPPRVNPGSSAVMNAAHYPGVEPCSMAGRQT